MALKVDIFPSELRGEDKEFLKLKNHELLPKPPFTVLLLGTIGSGKTSLTWSMLNNWYKNYFDECIIFNGSLDSNDSWNSVKQKRVLVLNDWDNDAFETYFLQLERDQLKRRDEGKELLKVCILFDDMITQGILKRGSSTALERLTVRTRHINCSIIICSQSYKLLSRTTRMNQMYIFITSINDDELNQVAEEHSGLLSAKEMSKLYKKYKLKDKYTPFIIDYKEVPNRRFRFGFEKVLEIIPKDIDDTKIEHL
jgi:hypothetical protein